MKTRARTLEQLAHRPWPLPRSPWVMFQSWQNLLFAHWRVSARDLLPRVPHELVLEEYGGWAWVGLVPFWIADTHAHFLPPLPGASSFPEVNLRTYVRVGDKPGVYFFSLDAGNRLAVASARALYRLPYHHAAMSIEPHGDGYSYRSRRDDGSAELVCRYRPVGPPGEASPGSLEHFLTERYALYTVLEGGEVLRTEIHHAPWQLQAADAEIVANTMAAAEDVPLPNTPPVLHFSKRQDTLLWLPERLP